MTGAELLGLSGYFSWLRCRRRAAAKLEMLVCRADKGAASSDVV